ncbi:actin-binding protein IPP-like protein [Leptotrombidium deliense]|uniref:Kelch-like protein diablo n=1 Tax=Leptotrombidium deliense TaxID=299467 RepID=A0A443SID5_9ACAR|nr:actin-binding protein IPP-like protein [Leptotrombidium deliense]
MVFIEIGIRGDGRAPREAMTNNAEYWTKASSNFETYRKRGKFCDVQIKVENEVFNGHKVILSAASPYFEAMLTNGLREERSSFIEIHDMSSAVFSSVLDFIYSGDIDIREENVQEMLSAANLLQVQDVVNSCCSFLAKQLDPSNCVGIFLFAELHMCTNLKLEAKRYIERNFTDVVHQEEFIDLPKEMLKNFLRSEGLSIYNELEVFEATIRWIRKDVKARGVHLQELMENVRLPVISPKQIDLSIEQCPDAELKSCLNQLIHDLKEKNQSDNQMLFDSGKRGDLSCDAYFNIKSQPRMCCRKNVYVIGGVGKSRGRRWGDARTLATVDKFDDFKRQWISTLPPMRYARCCHSVTVYRGLIYVAGGERDSFIYDSVEVFDPQDEEWKAASCLLHPRTCFGMVTCDDFLYIFGGNIGVRIDRSIHRYDPYSDKWEEFDFMKLPLYAMGVTSHNGIIYVIGGLDDYNHVQNSVYSFDPETRHWKQLRPMFEGRAFFGLTILHDFIYVIGGTQDCRARNAMNTVERYSITENTWTRVSNMKHHRISPCVVTINNGILVAGGRGNSDNINHRSDSVEVYNPEENVWRDSIHMSSSRHDAAAVVL